MREKGSDTALCICESHYHIFTCTNYFITCSHTVVTGKRTECKEEEIVLPELFQTDRRNLSSKLGYISPVPRGQNYYSPSKVIVWQLQAMVGHRENLELSHIDLHNEDGNCSDYIEISFNLCTPPTNIHGLPPRQECRSDLSQITLNPPMALGSEEHITTIQSTLAVSLLTHHHAHSMQCVRLDDSLYSTFTPIPFPYHIGRPS